MLKAPEFELEKDDAKKLAEASANLMAFYNVSMTPKQEAFALLIQAGAMVYPPMVASYVMRLRMEAEAKRKHLPPKVTPLRPAPRAEPLTVVHPVKPPNTGSFDPFNIGIPDGA